MATRFSLALAILVLAVPNFIYGQSKTSLVEAHLVQNHKSLDLTISDISGFNLSKEFTSKNGVTHVYLEQAHNGIPVFNGIINANIAADGDILSVGNRFVSSLDQVINATSPGIDAFQALQNAVAHLGLQSTESFIWLENPSGLAQEGLISKSGISSDDIQVRLVYQPLDKLNVRLAWEFVINELSGQHWWQIRMDAQSGEFLQKNDWVSSCNWDESCGVPHFRAPKENMKLPDGARNPFLNLATECYNVYALPVESPIHGGRSLELAPWNDNLAASPFGWHDIDGVAGAEFTYTRGNNVWSQEDQNNDNGTGYSPDGGANLDFDFPVDLTMAPITYEDAAITNLFYYNNIMHDVWYNYGFDEASGNFQDNNYGNGGLGADYVFADAQDGGGVNNANFGTPPDGSNPRMQMYLWNVAPAPIFTADGTSYNSALANFGPSSGTYTADLVIVDDGTAAPSEGCFPLINGVDVAGKIAVVDRGNCTFVSKVQNAQDAGAIAVVVCNNVPGAPFNMGGTSATIVIPSIMISQADCDIIKSQMASGVVNATIELAAAVDRDGDFDNGIIAHEYGHGISNRLTGGGNITSCLFNNEQMGEGWSDYFGLMTTIELGDIGTDARPIGTFALGEAPSGGGIRTYPYSTDMGINPHTYADIAGEAVPHGVGSVWCAMLWDMTWALVDIYGFDPDFYNGTGGNNIAMQLVMDGLKLQACSPGFTDGRDAILLADQINNSGAHQCLIWQVFANRGLGFSADQASTASATDGTEAFDMPPICTLDITKVGLQEVEAGTSMTYTITVTNNTDTDVTNVEITDQIPPEVTYVGGSSSCSAVYANPTLTITLGTIPAGSAVVCTYQVAVPASPFSVILFQDDMENGVGTFLTSSPVGAFDWSQTTGNSNSSSTSWFAVDPDIQSDQYLDLPGVGPISGTTELSFWHEYSTETDWDGGVLEISTDGGTLWTDLGPFITLNGYNGPVQVNPDSPISGRDAFHGNSGGWIQTIVDLSSFSGLTGIVRWRMASDAFVAGNGWWVDDVFVTDSYVAFSNQACVSSAEFPTSCDAVSTVVVESACTPVTWYADTDNDLHGDPFNTVDACTAPAGYVADNTDCNDGDADIFPGNPEVCDGKDNDCNSLTDDGLVFTDYYPDGDSDGFGNAATAAVSTCDGAPAGHVADNTDCNDNDPDVFPGNPEICDGKDNDCNGSVDDTLTFTDYYPDTDNDGFGDASATAVSTCDGAPAGLIADDTDCDDTNNTVYPGAPGTAEGIDNNCNGVIDPAEDVPCSGDFNNSGAIDVQDLLIFLADVGCVGSCVADMNNDGLTNSADLLEFLGVFGTLCP